MNRFLGSVALLIVGAALLVGAASGRASTGGTLRLGMSSGVDYVDPALAYYSPSWMLEYATCAKLYNHPGAEGRAGLRLAPEVAIGFPKVSGHRLTHTFELKKTYRFHTGAPVTAHSFADALHRDANPRMHSAATQYMRDIVGVEEVMGGTARTISGVRALSRYRLQIRTTRPAPDLPARLAMPFFCPILPRTRIEPDGIVGPGSGPYYVDAYRRNSEIVLKRNRFYSGPRAANVDRVVISIGKQPEACAQAVERGEIDYCVDGLPPNADTIARYGINRRRFFVKPSTRLFALVFDTAASDVFRANPELRQAVNHAIDRQALLAAAGPLAGQRTDQIIPPSMPGFRETDLYPLKAPDYARAKMLAAGRTRGGRVDTRCRGIGDWQHILRFSLGQIGLELGCSARFGPSRGTVSFTTLGGDFADPMALFAQIFDAQSSHTRPLGELDTLGQRRLASARTLAGPRRLQELGQFDVAVTRELAPIVPLWIWNHRLFVSARVRNVVVNPLYGLDLAAIRLT